MSLRKQVLEEVDALIGEYLDGAIGAIERSVLRKQAQPSRWAAFHSGMYQALPDWAKIRRAWHKMRARRFKALADVKAQPLTAQLEKAFPSA